MRYEGITTNWEPLGQVDPKSLVDARVEAHWAAQIVGAVGEAAVPHEADFSHTSMSWSNELRALAGQTTPRGTTVALRLADMSLIVLRQGRPHATKQLEGMTLDDALDWTVAQLEGVGEPDASRAVIPDYEMPDHAVRRGAPFRKPDKARLEELARWYANAARLCGFVSENTLGASPVRCWPHHFDIATLVALDPPGGDSESGRSIGLGLSPGDGNYVEPYFYANPWPYPETREGHHPLAGGGHWHTEGWFGAVLPASAFAEAGGSQAEQVLAYAKSAMAANRIILGAL